MKSLCFIVSERQVRQNLVRRAGWGPEVEFGRLFSLPFPLAAPRTGTHKRSVLNEEFVEVFILCCARGVFEKSAVPVN